MILKILVFIAILIIVVIIEDNRNDKNDDAVYEKWREEHHIKDL